MSYLLDTCILSRLRKLRVNPEKRLIEWLQIHPEECCFISVMSIGEIQKGISKLKEQERAKKMILEDWLLGELIPRFKGRILSVDIHTASIWGELIGKGAGNGILFPVVDSLLAASAIQNNLILVTENTKDFVHTGVHLLNPLSLS